MKNYVFILFILVPSFMYAQLAWDYPVKPNTEEWVSLGNYQKRVNACQIPEEILSKLKTQELLELCFKYPFWFEILSSHYETDGINDLVLEFNGLRNFIDRKDCISSLINSIYDLNKNIVLNNSLLKSIQLAEMVDRERAMERLLCIDFLMSKTNESELVTVIKMAMQIFIKKQKKINLYGKKSLFTSAYLLCVSMNRSNNKVSKNHVLNDFLNYKIPYLTREVVENLIIMYSQTIN